MSSSSDPTSSSVDDPIIKALVDQFQSIAVCNDGESVILNGESTTEPQHPQLEQYRHQLDSSENGDREEIRSGGEDTESGDGGAGAHSVLWRRNNSELEVDGLQSPSSSGYAGERGSSIASSASRIDEVSDDGIHEAGRSFGGGGVLSSESSWVPGKRHVDEDDSSITCRKRKKHFLMLSNSGKPIYSRYGDEHKLAGFSAILQAIISFVENGDDRVKLVRAGNHQVVFLVKGPIYLVCISSTE